MAHTTMETVRRYLRRFEQDEASDEVLLRRFVAEGDEQAFALLVRRHGPMVLGTSRRITGGSEAEDVLQATFLNLARDARSIRNPATLASWLHRVAHRTARKSRVAFGLATHVGSQLGASRWIDARRMAVALFGGRAERGGMGTAEPPPAAREPRAKRAARR